MFHEKAYGCVSRTVYQLDTLLPNTLTMLVSVFSYLNLYIFISLVKDNTQRLIVKNDTQHVKPDLSFSKAG